ncbi:hypothetical protein PIB30_096888 [Stylosanthes scabra]|uniref:Transposase (putative) gypsy type domain-containing protein n=1 Tax=Stylosanthes scabra TaxID=79078 RepID=A0ABU6YYZ7_9FABA|nr:hypothetical protein [Stylosanthes scabra]
MAENLQGDQPAERAVQIPRELSFIYKWVTNDVLGTPSVLDQQYLAELKLTGVLFGGGDLERRYRVEAARRGEWVCFINLDHPTVPHWLWVNEVMFTEFGIRVPFSDFQQRFLNRASVAPSQLHPNAWSSIRCFELVIEFLELPQDPEVFLYLFKLYCSNTSGKTKKGYMSVRPGKNRKIFALYEDSFHDFKGRYFKSFPVGDHHPFWLSLEGDGRFPSYWSDQAGFDIVPATYQRLNADQCDTADILIHLFAKNNLNPKFIMNNSDEARKAVVEIAGNDVTMSRLRNLLRPPPTRARPSVSGPPSDGRARSPPAAAKSRVVPEGESSSGVGREVDQLVDISSPLREEEFVHASSSPKKRAAEGGLAGSKRPRVSEEGEFSAMDRSFDASSFIGSHLLGPQASETLRDYDPVESVRWAEWTMLGSATILKSIEPRLTVADEVGRRNEKLLGDLKVLNLQKVVLEEQKAEAVAAQLKVEEDLRSAKAALEALKKEKDEEVGRLKCREMELTSEGERLRGLVAEEKVRADLSEVSVSELQKQCEDLAEDAKATVAATEGSFKAQLAILAPDFDTDQISFFKDIVDGKVVDRLIDAFNFLFSSF